MGVRADDFGVDLGLVRKPDPDPRRISGDVMVGENVAVRMNDRSGTGPAGFLHTPVFGGLGDDMDPNQSGVDFVDGLIDDLLIGSSGDLCGRE